ncbi:sulfotransferase family protein [Epibacterium ulvae]|uniref:sulfotransferase family 2 domain-containing protein n=1 Tax=Epibacterium ulvae TaxID=1156985 RepID=UPI001BFCCA38|nr:sulfotransferase family protein [Epibacterium ulvae]
MPIIKYKDVILHFAHIPKCGGTSVERYIQGLKSVSIAFIDERYVSHAPQQHWNISSPQHVDGESIARLFPLDFFTAFFAVVRHPMSRLKSAYKFQRTREKQIGSISFDEFVKTDLRENYLTKGWLDNHFYPQSGFFFPGANYQVFKLEEDGASFAKEFIDHALFGNMASRDIAHTNRSNGNAGLPSQDLELSAESVDLIHELYALDFKNFNYEPETRSLPEDDIATHPLNSRIAS